MRQVLPIETIVCDPATGSGQHFISGTRVLVTEVAIHHEAWGQPPVQIATQLGITLGQVYAALAYYHDHRDEIEADAADDDLWLPYETGSLLM